MGGGVVGDVVLAPFPYSDLSAAKTRPCLVLADVGMDDWVLCEITSRRQGYPGDIRIVQSDMRNGRLHRNGWVRPGRLHTLNDALLRRTVGGVSSAKQAEVMAAVRGLFV